MRGAWPLALLLAASCAAAVWAATPFRGFAGLAPREAPVAAGVGLGASVVLVVAITLAGAALVALARREARTPVQWFLLAAVAFGLLLLLVPVVAPRDQPLAWVAAVVMAACAALVLRKPGWPAWTASALAAGGYAGLLAALAGLPVLAVLVAAVALYDAWAVRGRGARMAKVADAADELSASALQVGRFGQTGRTGPSSRTDQAGPRRGLRMSLGLGDLLLPAALVAAAADPARPDAVLLATAAAAGALVGLAVLAVGVQRRGDLPGTPFLCGGALAGLALSLTTGLLTRF